MSVITNNLLLGDEGYFLTKSLRFRSSASAYLNRTPASAGNLRMWTLSWWTKRGQISTASQVTMFGTEYTSNQEFQFQFRADNKLVFEQYTAGGATFLGNLISTQVFRDPAAWYHIVVTWDSAQSTSSNRIKVYVNGVQITAWDTASYPAQNADSIWNNSTNAQFIGKYSSAKHYDGYMTEVNFIDGQALTPSSFGETSTSTGVWIPKKYTGTYGTNGFYLPFTDVATTSGSNAGLGKDFSGNGNYWTTNNISVTSGSTYDSMKDVPTLTDTDTANYCTLNPLQNAGTLSEANLKWSGSNQSTHGTIAVNTNKYYFEAKVESISGGTGYIGISDDSWDKTDGSWSFSQTFVYITDGRKGGNGSSASYGATYTAGDTIGIAFDVTGNTIEFFKNNTSQGVAFTTGLTGKNWRPFSYFSASSTLTFNFGQRPFAYTPPTGFKALNTFNLPTPTIGATATTQANDYFDATLYTGNGSTQSITNSGSMQPDWVWIKARSAIKSHCITDAVRGTNLQLASNSTGADQSTTDGITAFNSNGFSLGAGVQQYSSNDNGTTYVAWQWKANGSGSTNTAGSITSTVSANTTAGFSIATYTGNGSTGATIGHGLGVTPSMIIVKKRSSTGNWITYHTSTGINQYLYLNSTSASNTASPTWGVSSTTITFQQLFSDYNDSGVTYVAYCFAQVAGYSAFGSYTGNGSSDGTFVHLGFRPKFVMIKQTNSTNPWIIQDSARATNNITGLTLYPNSSAAEESYTIGASAFDFLSNGFKNRDAGSAQNGSGSTYIYMAFAEHPFKYSLGK